jgi:hypothetical protein
MMACSLLSRDSMRFLRNFKDILEIWCDSLKPWNKGF